MRFFIFGKGSTCKSSISIRASNEFTSLLRIGDVAENDEETTESWKSLPFIQNRPRRKTFLLKRICLPKTNGLGLSPKQPQEPLEALSETRGSFGTLSKSSLLLYVLANIYFSTLRNHRFQNNTTPLLIFTFPLPCKSIIFRMLQRIPQGPHRTPPET